MIKENVSKSERKNDEFPNPEELKKQGVRDEEDRIGNNYKEPVKDNLLSKGNKNENNEDNINGNESNAVSDADRVPGLILIKNSSRKKLKLQRLASLNAFFADTSEPELSYRLEREQLEKEQKQESCQNVEDNTEESQLDVIQQE
ncbi:uncharacterized protein LOC113559097 [Rhopalosiphum maidis]|uniref:uncharacterized protein LOC113559097 n=1 Tax=Rhopalosiphum maidis TaxID=43146 RepID=UPI000F001D58|nr:uncharacterized protein LOC113559097 [Rhopalosiphum maidis]